MSTIYQVDFYIPCSICTQGHHRGYVKIIKYRNTLKTILCVSVNGYILLNHCIDSKDIHLIDTLHPLPFLQEHGFDLEPIHYQIKDPCFKYILSLVYSQSKL
jgi:hypothetical protein